MQPLNKNERSRAFGNFIIFFIVTVALIVVTAFFSFQVPFKDNERLRELDKKHVAENDFRNSFQMKTSDVVRDLDAVNDPKFASQAEGYDGRILGGIRELNKMIAEDTSIAISQKDFYRSIIDVLNACKEAKKQWRDLESKGSEAAEYKRKYDDLYKEYDNLKRQFDDYVQRTRGVQH